MCTFSKKYIEKLKYHYNRFVSLWGGYRYQIIYKIYDATFPTVQTFHKNKAFPTVDFVCMSWINPTLVVDYMTQVESTMVDIYFVKICCTHISVCVCVCL